MMNSSKQAVSANLKYISEIENLRNLLLRFFALQCLNCTSKKAIQKHSMKLRINRIKYRQKLSNWQLLNQIYDEWQSIIVDSAAVLFTSNQAEILKMQEEVAKKEKKLQSRLKLIQLPHIHP